MTYSEIISTGYYLVGNLCFIRVCAKANGDWGDVAIIKGLPRSKLHSIEFLPDRYSGAVPISRTQNDMTCTITNQDDGTATFFAATTYARFFTYTAVYEIEPEPVQYNAFVTMHVRHVYQGAKITVDLYIDDVLVERLGSETELIKSARCFKSREVAIRNDGTQKIYGVATIHDPGLSGIMCEATLRINNVHKCYFGWGTTVMTKSESKQSTVYTV